jgi:hypothetical protein
MTMLHRFTALLATAGAVATMGVVAVGATASSSLPTTSIALHGVSGITVSGTPVSGANTFTVTFSGKLPKNSNGPSFGLVRLNPGATIGQAAGAVNSHHGDLNAINPYGALIADAGPGSIETVLTPGNYVALNISGNGQPGFAQFTVKPAASPAALPKANATETSIEFGFQGPSVLHNGWMVRTQNHGWLVHMIVLAGVKNKAAGLKAIALLKAGKDNKAFRYTNGQFPGLMGPVSPGGMQQQVLHAKPGYYIEACFMNTEDGREHTQLGMERLIKVVG